MIETTRLEAALQSLAAGRPVLLVDDDSTEVVLSAMLADTHWTAWAIRHTAGLLCAALPASRADELDVPAMSADSACRTQTPSFGVAVDAAKGVGTGISATDRAHTARTLACRDSSPADLTRPGHVLTIRTAEGGTPERSAVFEAAVDLCRLAGLEPVALTATLLSDDGTEISASARTSFAHNHGVPIVDVGDVTHSRLHHGDGHRERVRSVGTRTVDIPGGTVQVTDFVDELTGASHFACIAAGTTVAHPVHVVTESSQHDPFVSGAPSQQHFERQVSLIAHEGGIVVYLRSAKRVRHRWAVSEDALMHGAAAAIVAHIRRTLAGERDHQISARASSSLQPSPH